MDLIETLCLLPMKHEKIKERLNDYRNDKLHIHVMRRLKKFLMEPVGKISNLEYTYDEYTVKDNNCGCCGNGENCGSYDYDYLHITFNTEDEPGQSNILEVINHRRYEENFVLFNHVLFYYGNTIDDEIHADIVENKTITIKKYHSGPNRLSVPFNSIKNVAKDINAITESLYVLFKTKMTKETEYIPSRIMYCKSDDLVHLRRNTKHDLDTKPIIWIETVVVLILCANRFSQDSIINKLPLPIVRIIAHDIYDSLETWIS